MDPSLDPATSQPLEAELQPFVQVCVAAGTAVSTEQMVEIEQWLNAAATTPGFTVSLLRIAINSTVEPNARLFAATQLKVRLQKAVATFTAAHGAYASRDADLAAALHEFQNTVPREDLVVLANNVLQSLASCSDSKIRAQLAVVVDSLVYANKYSEYWTDLLATVRTFLSDGRPAYQQAAATTLDCFADSYYNLDTDEEKAAVQAMLEATFPFIVHHLQSATTVATHEHRKLCCDLLNTLQQLTVYSLPSHLVASIEQFLSWFQPVMHIAAMPISEPAWAYQQAINLDPEADENEVLHSEWTLKRKAFKLFMKLHTRYGLRENATPEYEAFADAFEQSLSVPLQLITLQTFEQSEARGIRLAIGVARHGWTFLLNVMSVKGCWQQLKPFLPIVLAQLCEWQRFVDEELEDMEDDPIYFLSFHDDADSFKSTVPDVARQFLYELCYRRTSMVFEDINNFIQQRMNAQPAPTPDDMEAAKAKVATMRMAFIACRVMRSRKAYQPMLEPALLYFFPAELTSPHPMVRFVALWCLRNFCLVYKFKKIETPAAILQASMPLLHDPVAVVALEAFNLVSTLARESPICRPLFVAELEPMVTRLVNLMQTSKVRFPSIPTYLSQFVQSYSTEMTSLAGLVLQHLYQSFVRAMTDESDPEAADEDEAQGGAPDALNALEAMQEILYAYEDADTPYANEVVFAAAQPSVFQLLMDVVSHHLANYLEGALELVTSVISNQQQVSPDVVALFSKIFENYHSHYLSYTPEFVDLLIQCVNVQVEWLFTSGMAMSVVEQFQFAFVHSSVGDQDRSAISRVLQAILLQAIAQDVRELVPPEFVSAACSIVGPVAFRQQPCIVEYLPARCLEFILVALAFNGLQGYSWLVQVQGQGVPGLLEMVRVGVAHADTIRDHQLLVAALVAILAMPVTDLPADVLSCLPHIGMTLSHSSSRVLDLLDERHKFKANLAKRYENEDFDNDDEPHDPRENGSGLEAGELGEDDAAQHDDYMAQLLYKAQQASALADSLQDDEDLEAKFELLDELENEDDPLLVLSEFLRNLETQHHTLFVTLFQNEPNFASVYERVNNYGQGIKNAVAADLSTRSGGYSFSQASSSAPPKPSLSFRFGAR